MSKRFDADWTNRGKFYSLLTMAFWFIRGSIRRLFFKKTKGLVLIGPSVKIPGSHLLTVGKNFIAERGCEINCISKNGIEFGDKVTIGSYAIIRPSNIYGGEVGEGLKVGNNSNIGPYAYIGCSGFIEIGDNVMISPRVSIYAENHNFDSTESTIKEQGVTKKSVTIEDDCWIAANSVILAGVIIGKGSVIAAGSVVTKNIPPYSVVAGVPAKVIQQRK